MTFSILGQLRSNFGPASVNFGPVSVRLRSGSGAAVSARPGGYTSARFRSTSVPFRSGFGPVSVRLWRTSVRLCHYGPTSVQLRSGFGPALGRLFQHAQVAALRPGFGQLRHGFGSVSVRLWLTSVCLCVQFRSGFGPTLGRLFRHAQGLGEFDVVLDPWPITRILTSSESVVYLIEFIS